MYRIRFTHTNTHTHHVGGGLLTRSDRDFASFRCFNFHWGTVPCSSRLSNSIYFIPKAITYVRSFEDAVRPMHIAFDWWHLPFGKLFFFSVLRAYGRFVCLSVSVFCCWLLFWSFRYSNLCAMCISAIFPFRINLSINWWDRERVSVVMTAHSKWNENKEKRQRNAK